MILICEEINSTWKVFAKYNERCSGFSMNFNPGECLNILWATKQTDFRRMPNSIVQIRSDGQRDGLFSNA
ncbi:MAG: hypothetical protein EZS28_018031 [Streblomastix strix]|uniref:Uncharacterized protein n=1 Tax=Streblomastix strix TaxID=222440 RepID=A0A5J4VVA1_9EUKA|nr:MAG: hypothetical protein EZS28_018031 [Streblomastix strix]